MKKVIPFTKTIPFETMIAEITDIEIKHNLEFNSKYDVSGNILVDGKYKMTDASQIEEDFHYELPFTINIDDRYNTDNAKIYIEDFYFEIINEEDLKINVEIGIKDLEEEYREIENMEIEDEVLEIPFEKEEKIEKLEIEPLDNLEKELEVERPNNINNIFNTIDNKEETFKAYYVYIVRENDTIESIINKYKITKDDLENYNDLNNIKLGTKIIIPCSKDE